MLIAITKDLLLQNRTPSHRLDDGYFKRALSRLEEVMQASQRQGVKHCIIDGAFIESISTSQAFAVFGMIQRYPVTIIWSARDKVPAHIKDSGLCLFAERDCVLSIGNATIRQVNEGVTFEAFDSSLSVPQNSIPRAMAADEACAPELLIVELAKRGRAKHASVSISSVALQDDREFVRVAKEAPSANSLRVTHTEFVESLQRHLAERRSANAVVDIEKAIVQRASSIETSGDVSEYLLKLCSDVCERLPNEHN